MEEKNFFVPYNIQLFADDGTDNSTEKVEDSADDSTKKVEDSTKDSTTKKDTTAKAGSIDYDKLDSIINGKKQVAEDTILKNYFKNNGLSQEDAQAAIKEFKEKQKAKVPDVEVLKNQLSEYKTQAEKAAVETAALKIGIELGVETKSIPYVLKMMDASDSVKDGKVDTKSLKKQFEAVLEAIPGLKTTKTGFKAGSGKVNNSTTADIDLEETLKGIFLGNKKKE